MSSSFSFGEVRLDVNPASPSSPARPDPETPFRIAVLGDFSGRGSRGIVESGQAMARRRRWLIDRDNLDEVMERLEVELDLPVAGKVRFRELEDFHPDRLYTELEMFQKLREAEQEAAERRVPRHRPAGQQRWSPGCLRLLRPAHKDDLWRLHGRCRCHDHLGV